MRLPDSACVSHVLEELKADFFTATFEEEGYFSMGDLRKAGEDEVRNFVSALCMPRCTDQQLLDAVFGDGKAEMDAVVASSSPAISSAGGSQDLHPEAESKLDSPSMRLQGALMPATTGLHNVGNTCFMSSSIQCLSNILELRDFFLSGQYQESLKILGKCQEQTNGKLAVAFHSMLRRLWSGYSNEVDARKFKAAVATFCDSMFYGADQHDAVEFLEYLVDGLKEDCNMVKGKKVFSERKDHGGRPDSVVALEAANSYLLRNDSVIDNLMAGFTRCSTRCPECGHSSALFEPFHSVKLPLENSKVRFTVFIARAASTGMVISRHDVFLHQGSCVGDLVTAAAQQVNLDPETCLLFDVWDGRIYREFRSQDSITRIDPEDGLLLYEMEEAAAFSATADDRWGPADELRVSDVVVARKSFFSNSEYAEKIRVCTHGVVLDIDEDGDACIKFDGVDDRQWLLERNFKLLKRDLNIDSEERRVFTGDSASGAATEPRTFRELVQESVDCGSSLLHAREFWRDTMRPANVDEQASMRSGVILNLRHEEGELFGFPVPFCIPRTSSIQSLVEAVHEKLISCFGPGARSGSTIYWAREDADAASTEVLLEDVCEDGWLREREFLVVEWKNGSRQVQSVFNSTAKLGEPEELNLERCFAMLTEQEQLSEENKIDCPGCKQRTRAYRKSDFWSLPPVLMLQLNRFLYDGITRRKLDIPVSFPLEGLDLRPFCISTSPSFPEGACLRAGQRAVIHGLQSAAGRKLNGQEGVAMYLDTDSGRFCVRLHEDHPKEEWKRVRPENLRPVTKNHTNCNCSAVAPTPIYDLVAVCVHMGSAHYGHYVAYVRSSVDRSWRLYDDECVSVVSASEVQDQCRGAYALFYAQRGSHSDGSCRSECVRAPNPTTGGA